MEEHPPVAYNPQAIETHETQQPFVPPTFNTPAPVIPQQPKPQGGIPKPPQGGSGGGIGTGHGPGIGSGSGPGSGSGTGGGSGSGRGTGSGPGEGPGLKFYGIAHKEIYLPPDSEYAELYRNGKVEMPKYIMGKTKYDQVPEPIIPEGKDYIDGYVTLQFRVDENGSTSDVIVAIPSENAHEDQIIRKFIEVSTFTPGKVDGAPRSMVVRGNYYYCWRK